MNKKFYDALTSAIYVNAMTLNGKAIETDDQKLRAGGLYNDWESGNHTKGDIYNTHTAEGLGEEWNQTWECYQDYDNAVYPDIRPGVSAWYTFNRPLHGKSKETARLFVHPTHAEDIYRFAEWAIFGGKYCKCIAPNGTNFSPDEAPSLWEVDA